MSIGFQAAVLMCHAPIVIKEIAGDQFHKIAKSWESMSLAAQAVVRGKPDAIVLVSPHTPRPDNSYSIIQSDPLSGSFAPFGCPHLRVQMNSAASGLEKIVKTCEQNNLPIKKIVTPLDHGALVPLFFLYKEGWRGNTYIIGFPSQPDSQQNFALGTVLQNLARNLGEAWALISSGDMSHRLRPGAPCGYHPEAIHFDQQIVHHVRQNSLDRIQLITPDLRALAAEDVVDSLDVLRGATQELTRSPQLLSYENPFGVGYLVASFL